MSNYSNSIEPFELKRVAEYDYQLDNPVLDEDGKFKRMGKGWGKGNIGISRDARGEILAAHEASKAEIESSIIDAQSDTYRVETEAKAAIEVANIDADARIEESENYLEGVKYQADTDKEIAELEYKAKLEELKVEEKRINEVDSVNAANNTILAYAEQTKAEADMEESKGERARDEARA